MIPIPNPAAMFQEVVDEAVLVNADTGTSMALNRTGIQVWQLIDGKRSLEDIATEIKARYKNAPETVYDDIKALVDMLAEDGFVGYELLGRGSVPS